MWVVEATCLIDQQYQLQRHDYNLPDDEMMLCGVFR